MSVDFIPFSKRSSILGKLLSNAREWHRSPGSSSLGSVARLGSLSLQGVRENRTELSLVRPAFRWLILLQSVHTTKLFAKTRKWRLLPPSEIITT
jgi:hypothetical protein